MIQLYTFSNKKFMETLNHREDKHRVVKTGA